MEHPTLYVPCIQPIMHCVGDITIPSSVLLSVRLLYFTGVCPRSRMLYSRILSYIASILMTVTDADIYI